jgi:pyruvate ferredoxin oxidoreductase alpha subunit
LATRREELRIEVTTGTKAIARAVMLADVDVISAYPIRPYTGVMNELAKVIADGNMNAEFILADSEHSQFEIAKHASAVGARTFTGSSGTGFVYAMEAAVATALGGLPVVAMVGNRTLDDPGNFGMEHNDAFLVRDVGWLITWAQDPQEALDTTLMSYRVSEDHRVLLPSIIAVDGFSITHVASPVTYPSQELVADFLPPYKPPYPLDPDFGPVTKAQHIAPSMVGPELRKINDVAMKRAKRVIEEAWEEFARVFGRSYPPFIESYMMDDAETAFIIMGANALNLKAFTKKARAEGERVGVVRIRTFRPFPTEELREALSRVERVGVFDFDFSYGSPLYGGVLFNEVRSALYDLNPRPQVHNFICAGGRDVGLQEYRQCLKTLKESVKAAPGAKRVHWVGLRGRDL